MNLYINMKKILKNRIWTCLDVECGEETKWSYEDLAYNGQPSCPACGGNMDLMPLEVEDEEDEPYEEELFEEIET